MPWYVTAFLKLIGPFIDPVTKSKIKYNEPLIDHIPAAQLMKAAGGEVDFKYDHSIYWPALAKLAAERRQERTARWEKAEKLLGESEIYLWGGNEESIGAKKAVQGEVKTAEKATVEASSTETSATVKPEGAAELVDGVEKLDIKRSDPVKTVA